MTKFYSLSFLVCLIIYSCGQPQISNQAPDIRRSLNFNDTNFNKQLVVDTSIIAILPIDTTNHGIFKDATPLELTNEDLKVITKLLNDCISSNNSKQDAIKRLSEHINLKSYKRQYVPFISSKGERKVYVNCFCLRDFPNEFNYWKKILVEVDDGGSCFFHLTINLTSLQYEQIYINGYG